MNIGSLEIVSCALVAAGALAVYGLLVVFVGGGGSQTTRTTGLMVFGPPVLCVIAAAVTPPDLITMLLLAIPLGALYGATVVIWLLIRNKRQVRRLETGKQQPPS